LGCSLTNLTQLDLYSNQITKIPEAITQLTNLTQLNLGGNQITKIPEAIESLPKLKELDLRENPLPISPEILGSSDEVGSVKDIFNYLRLFHSGEVQPLNQAKLLLIGQGSVGKTSLIERLIRNKYDKNQPQTDGLNVETWNVWVNSKDIRLNVWDFGGQEIYHATHQFFLTKRSLYLLVCNCRTSEEENRIEYWLKLIKSFGGQSPVIIVGNKKDEQPLDINRKALREKYPNIQAIIETSCQDNIGIDELRTAIFQQIANLKEVYDLLPLSWFEVKQQLESMNENFITYRDYIGICYKNEIPEGKDQDQLIDLLHRLGLVLNFRDHPILKDTNVLKPNWVTEGIYALLSDENLKTKAQGIFTPADLTRILNPARYPTDRHVYLIDLMKKFELCFALECKPEKYLIAGLLPKDQPDKTELEGETLEFQYHYKFLPESIISRFIVNTHEKIHNQVYWRSGVMLQYEQYKEIYNIARIKSDPEDEKIFITISGRKETRRLFLGILREFFQKIHKTFPDLEITEWVPVLGYPKYPPLDYQELLGLEKMKVVEYPIGKLNININIPQLLDGYESRESRWKSQKGDHDLDDRTAYEDMLDLAKLAVSREINIHNKVEASTVTESYQSKYDQRNANNQFVDTAQSGSNVTFNQTNYTPEQKQSLAEAAAEIQNLLKQLDETNPTATESEQIAHLKDNTTPNFRKRALSALQGGTEAAIDEFLLENKFLKVGKAVIKGYLQPDS
jgi:internalin A